MAKDAYQVLARKWRPQRFDDVIGQDHITRTLKNAIASGRIHHAFLFIGSRGIGKTTTARILAKALNCLSADAPTTEPCGTCDNCVSISGGTNIDVIEIDGASNNSVDDVREIRDNIRMVPTNSRYKVYIIDEVHQLSAAAFNALLKTLEEPPPHAIFVLATTEAHKLLPTIISRCQRYDFRRVPIPGLVELLRKILEAESIKASDDALYAIARAADGGVRDSESILDELITYCEDEITFQDVFDVLGLVNWQLLHNLCDALLAKDIGELLKLVDDVVAGGKDLSQFVQEILRYYRNLLVYRTTRGGELLHLPEQELQEIAGRAEKFTLTQLIRLVEQLAGLTSGFDSQLAQRIALESFLIRVSKTGVDLSVDTVLEKLMLLSEGGMTAAKEPPPQNPPQAGPAETAAPVPARRQPKAETDNSAAPPSETPSEEKGSPAVRAEFREEDIPPPPEPYEDGEEEDGGLPPGSEPSRRETASTPDKPRVNPAAAHKAMAEPGLSNVIEAFRGTVVDIRHGLPAALD
jgi:DNA polymerase III subunit gamma/tau